MIRLEFVLRRKPSMSLAEFQKYWHSVHGPIVAKHATTLNILRYVQLHTLDDPMNEQMAKARGGMEPPYDGVAELWWTSREALAAAFGSSAGQAAGQELLEDEARFIDLPNSPLWLAYEYPQVNPSEDIVARAEQQPGEDFLPAAPSCRIRRWSRRSSTGAPITVRSFADSRRQRPEEVFPGASIRGSDRAATARDAAARKVPPYTGHAEAWIDRAIRPRIRKRDARERSRSRTRANFIDFKNSSMWIAKERVVIDRR